MNKIVKILMERDNYSKEMAINEVDQMKNLVLRGHNPEDLLYEIYEFLCNIFKTEYNYEQIALILEDFDYGSMNAVSAYIFNSNLSDKCKLCLCQKLISTYNDNIDTSKKILLSMKNFKPYLIYYLYTMSVPEDLINNYYYTWGMVLDNRGGEEINIIDDNKLNDKIKQRYQVIKDNFNL